MKQLISLLWQYRSARKTKFSSRPALLRHQDDAIEQHLDWLTRHSAYYRPYRGKHLSEFPLVDKQACLAHFDAMNTAGLSLATIQDVALKAELTRDFSPTIAGYTVGLSSGTSGKRGVFVVSPAERAKWAGIALARLLPDGLLGGERIAFFLRAGSNLYSSVETSWINFQFFDLLEPFDSQLTRLELYQPSIIVAPAQVLRRIALEQHARNISIRPKRVISVAEVLEESDRQLIDKYLAALAEVYQATEGFIGYTCHHGIMHLNEEYLHVEPEWIDSSHTRMVPIITDFSRTTQPVVRYRLNDVLTVRQEPCPCGNPATALLHIEGRCDDQLNLPAKNGATVSVFADCMSRICLQALPLHLDYRLTQTAANRLLLECAMTPAQQARAIHLANKLLEHQGVAVDRLEWITRLAEPPFDPAAKRRRIRREAFA